MAMKTCTGCGEEKPLTAEYFHRYKRSVSGYNTRCKICRNKINTEYREANPEKASANKKKWREENREKVRAQKASYIKDRRRSNPALRLHQNLRGGLYSCLSGKQKKSHTLEYVGMDMSELWKHLESKFTDGMTRENYGEWHVDHIRPLCSFDFDQFEQGPEEYENLIHEAWHYTNLQPLWAKDNISKGGKWEGVL